MMRRTVAWSGILLGLLLWAWLPTTAVAQEQSRESAALDNTAAAWSFQFAGQAMPDYRADTLANGDVRPEGNKGFAQFRMVAPIKVAGLSVLPRLTLRYSQNRDGEWGISPTDLFALILPFDWGTGRAGFGPDIVIPGSSKVGSSEWSYGLAGAVIQRFFNDKMMVGLLVQQTWGQRDVYDLSQGVTTGEVETGANPMIINPFINYQLGKGWYIGTNDLQAQYSWEFGGWKVPIGARLGYVLVNPTNSWNFYVEYATDVATDDWPGAAAKSKFRVNASYSMPVG
ncbi:MAG: hypothetical protein KJO44_01485 [Gemmatimonadetes bacterium]|nr:hypothetical protein [Gemmatimonadota bacterium]MBT8477361.1 hypothetical protein [Gemmatimonadota bacterium]NNK47320.1 hypothetical protein [Gemmatimonadota bacterium]